MCTRCIPVYGDTTRIPYLPQCLVKRMRQHTNVKVLYSDVEVKVVEDQFYYRHEDKL